MKVEVVYYGSLMVLAGGRREELVVDGAVTVSQVAEAALAAHPALRSQWQAVAYAVGDRIVGAEHPVAEGDEVGFLPPVSGG